MVTCGTLPVKTLSSTWYAVTCTGTGLPGLKVSVGEFGTAKKALICGIRAYGRVAKPGIPDYGFAENIAVGLKGLPYVMNMNGDIWECTRLSGTACAAWSRILGRIAKHISVSPTGKLYATEKTDDKLYEYVSPGNWVEKGTGVDHLAFGATVGYAVGTDNKLHSYDLTAGTTAVVPNILARAVGLGPRGELWVISTT